MHLTVFFTVHVICMTSYSQQCCLGALGCFILPQFRVQNEQFSEEKGFIQRYTEKEV